MLAFRRSTGEELDVADDASFTMRRVVAACRVGRFAGTVPAASFDELRTAIEQASSVDPPAHEGPWTADGGTESLTVGDTVVEVDPYEEPAGPWGALVAACRALLDDLTQQPSGAVELEVTADPLAARLRQVGDEPAPADLAGATVEAYLMGADSSTLGSWSATIESPPAAGAVGWELDLGLGAAGFTPADGATCEVTVALTINDPFPFAAIVSASAP